MTPDERIRAYMVTLGYFPRTKPPEAAEGVGTVSLRCNQPAVFWTIISGGREVCLPAINKTTDLDVLRTALHEIGGDETSGGEQWRFEAILGRIELLTAADAAMEMLLEIATKIFGTPIEGVPALLAQHKVAKEKADGTCEMCGGAGVVSWQEADGSHHTCPCPTIGCPAAEAAKGS